MTHLQLIGTIIALGFIVVGIMLWVYLRRHDSLKVLDSLLPSNTRSDRFVFALGVAALIGLMVVRDDRTERFIAQEESARALDRASIAAGYLPASRAKITLDINDLCPPRTDGMTDIVTMSISAQADMDPVMHGCSRIADPYIIKSAARK